MGGFRGAKSSAFARGIVDRILVQPECAGLRIYFGLGEDGSPHPVLVGVTEQLDDLYEGVLADTHLPCPPFCWGANPLSSELSAAPAGVDPSLLEKLASAQHEIRLEHAVSMTRRYRADMDEGGIHSAAFSIAWSWTRFWARPVV